MDQSYSILWLCLLEVQWASVKHWISSCWAIAVPQVHLVVPAKTRIRNAWTKRAGHGELSDSSMCSAMYDHVCHVHSCGSSVSFARHTCCNWSLRRQHRREMQIWLDTCCVGLGQTMVKSSCNTISQGWTYMCCLPAILKLWGSARATVVWSHSQELHQETHAGFCGRLSSGHLGENPLHLCAGPMPG